MKFTKGSLFGSYDESYDILYIYFKGKNYSYGEEVEDGIVTFKSIEKDSPTGFLIYDFKDKVDKGLIDFEKFELVFKVTLKELAKEVQNGNIVSW